MEELTTLNKDKIIETVKKMADFMDIECSVETKEELGDKGRSLLISINTPSDAKFIIGKNGQNLQALEHLIRIVIMKSDKELKNVVLDVNDYRKSRVSLLVDLAKQAVARVRNTQKAEALAPMSAYERRVVHMELASYPDIATESIGDGPQRRVVIKPYP